MYGPGSAEPRDRPGRVREAEEAAGLAADQRECRRHPRLSQILPDQLAGRAARQPRGEYVVPEGPQHPGHGDAAAAGSVAGPGDRGHAFGVQIVRRIVHVQRSVERDRDDHVAAHGCPPR